MDGEDQDNANPDARELFEQHRPLLFSIAYSIVGIVADAEGLTQETLQRWLQCADPNACGARIFLVTTLAALCIEYLQQSEIAAEVLPSMVASRESPRCPFSDYAADNSTSTSVLTLLGHLTPLERVIFLLETIFKYDYSEIAQVTGKCQAECEQIAHRVKAFMIRNRAQVNFNPSLYVSQT